MRILVAHNVSRDYPGGMMRLMHLTHEPLVLQGHTVEYFCSEDVPSRWNGRLARRFAFPWLVYRKARRALAAGKPYDIINVHEPVSAVVALLKQRLGARVVVTSHGLEHRSWRLAREEAQLGRVPPALRTRLLHPATLLSQCRVGIANADHLFCLSDDDRQYLKVHFGCSNQAITRIFPGALPVYQQSSAGRDYASWHRLLFAGTWRKNKGIEDFVPTVTQLMRYHPQMELHVLGGGIPKVELLSHFPSAFHSRICLHHTKTDAENASIMADSDIFVLPSLFEGTPLTLMEAMASGLPVVTTETCGMADVIEDDHSGLLSRIRSPRDLVRSIERLIENRDLRRSLGQRAQADIVARYSWDASAQTVQEAYEHVLHQHSSPESERSSRRMLFAIHAPRDVNTAVYRNTKQRAAYLEEQGWQCTILSADDFRWVRGCRGRFTSLLYPFAVAMWLFRRSKDFDVVTFHSYAGWLVLRLSRLLPRFRRLRSVVQFHGLEPLYYRHLKEQAEREGHPLSWRYRLISGHLMLYLLRMGCRRSDMVLCLSTDERRYLVEHGWADPSRIHQIAHPVPENFLIQRQHPKRATRLLFVGQWLNMKGVRYLVDAFTQLRSKHAELNLCCAGTLADADTVLRSFPDHVRSSVQVFSRVTKSELLQIHRDSDLFVFPTLWEGFGLAVVEAMATGLPIVTTPVGVSSDILHDGDSVVFCPAHDAEALASRVSALLDDPSRREQLGHNAQRAAERLRPESVWGDYAMCLSELVDRDIDPVRRMPVENLPGMLDA